MGSPDQNKIIWFLWGNPKFTASSRIHGLLVHNKLIELGYNSTLAYIPTYVEEFIPLPTPYFDSFTSLIESCDIIILQKIKDQTHLPLLEHFKSRGLRIILIDCDLPLATEISRAVDGVICASKVLCKKYFDIGVEAAFIEDSPELFFKRPPKEEKGKLKCFWFGDGSHRRWSEVVLLKQIMKDPRLSKWELITVSNHREATIAWQPGYLKLIKEEADIVALPVFNSDEESSVKSANRLLQSLALSLPVICSPLPSYQDIAASGKGIVVCQNQEDWVNAFLRLQDAGIRSEMGYQAFEIAQPYSLDHSIQKWIEALGLSEKFMIHDLKKFKEAQRQINKFFYAQLIKKNITYLTKTPLSFHSFAGVFFYFSWKIRSLLKF